MVRTRFAPSPTGFLHIGNFRTALYAYVLAKHNKGQFILRIEDTDQKREVEGATEALQKILKTFGLNWDEFYIQSQRHKLGIYKKAAEKLVSEGHAFYCQCPAKNAKEDGFSTILQDPCREKNFSSGAIKLKVPINEKISYFDFVHKKEIVWDTNDVYDATLLKTDGFPTYHLAAMVDDIEMKVSHILRGHDWLPSTPIHLLVFKYLGGTRPEIGHLSDILSAATGKKLSKRRDSVFVEDFISKGYLPEALLNFVLLLGWAPKDNTELFTLDEFVDHFDAKGFQEANPRFEDKKLNWFNGYYIRQKSDEELVQLFKQYLKFEANDELLSKVIPLIKDRVITLLDINTLAGFLFTRPEVVSGLNKDHVQMATDQFGKVDWQKEDIENALQTEVKNKSWKNSDFFMTLRLAVSGQKITPPMTECMLILGRDEVLARLTAALHVAT